MRPRGRRGGVRALEQPGAGQSGRGRIHARARITRFGVRARLLRASDPAPIAGTQVELASKERLWTLEGNGAHPTTDDAGRFDLTGLRRGRYRLSAPGCDDAEVAITADDTDLGDVEMRAAAK